MDDKDFTVVVNGRKIRTQRRCLEEKSDYFKALFSSGLRESVTNSVKIQNIDVSTIRQIIAYCERDHIVVHGDNAYQLWEASDRLLIYPLKASVEDFLLRSMSPSNVTVTFAFCDVCNSKSVREACIRFVCCNLAEVLPFVTSECYDLVRCILARRYSHRDENLVYRAAMAACIGRDSSDLSDLMEMLFLDNVTSHSVPLDLYRALMPKGGSRKSCESVGVISEDGIVYVWDRRQLHLRKLTTLPVKHAGVMFEKHKQFMYLIGGESRIGFGNWNRTVYRYDSVRDVWEDFTSMKDCLRSCTSVLASGKVYLFHGYGKYRIDLGDGVVALDLESREWSRTKYVFRQASLPCRGLIFRDGSFYHVVKTSTVYKFTEEELLYGKGTVISMNGVRSLSVTHAFASDDYVVAIGFQNELVIWHCDSNEAYLLSQSFHDKPCLYCKLVDSTLYVIEDKLFEYEIDFEAKSVKKIGEYEIRDGSEPLIACNMCSLPYF